MGFCLLFPPLPKMKRWRSRRIQHMKQLQTDSLLFPDVQRPEAASKGSHGLSRPAPGVRTVGLNETQLESEQTRAGRDLGSMSPFLLRSSPVRTEEIPGVTWGRHCRCLCSELSEGPRQIRGEGSSLGPGRGEIQSGFSGAWGHITGRGEVLTVTAATVSPGLTLCQGLSAKRLT